MQKISLETIEVTGEENMSVIFAKTLSTHNFISTHKKMTFKNEDKIKTISGKTKLSSLFL